MAYNRILKTNLVLLVLVLIGIGASSFALYAGNKKFIGILGIALLALVLVFWRIFSLTRNPATVSEQKQGDIDLTWTWTSFSRFGHHRSEDAPFGVLLVSTIPSLCFCYWFPSRCRFALSQEMIVPSNITRRLVNETYDISYC